MKYKAVLFDMDGTVLNTLDDLHDAINAALRHFSMPEISREETMAYVGNGSKRLVELAVPNGTDSETVEAVLAWYKPWYNDHSRISTKPYAGIVPLMQMLKAAGMRLAVVSNKPDRTVGELAEYYFPGLLEFAVGETATVRRKPWPDTLDTAVSRMVLNKKDCVYVGDSEVDIATAKNAGMDCIAVSWGFRSVRQLIEAGAEKIAAAPEELYSYIMNSEW